MTLKRPTRNHHKMYKRHLVDAMAVISALSKRSIIITDDSTLSRSVGQRSGFILSSAQRMERG